MLFFLFTGPVNDYVKNLKIIYTPFSSATPSGIKKNTFTMVWKKNHKFTTEIQSIIEV